MSTTSPAWQTEDIMHIEITVRDMDLGVDAINAQRNVFRVWTSLHTYTSLTEKRKQTVQFLFIVRIALCEWVSEWVSEWVCDCVWAICSASPLVTPGTYGRGVTHRTIFHKHRFESISNPQPGGLQGNGLNTASSKRPVNWDEKWS